MPWQGEARKGRGGYRRPGRGEGPRGDLQGEGVLLSETVCTPFPSKRRMPCVQVVEKLKGKAFGSVMILAASGGDQRISDCFLAALSSGSTVHTLALGSSAVDSLEELARLTGEHVSRNALQSVSF